MESNDQKKPKKKIFPFILGALIIAGSIYGVIKYRYAKHHEVTDDAQIDGDISPVFSRVAGYVNEIRFEENQAVKKGDTLIVLDDRDLQIKVQQARAALENAVAALDVAKANISGAMANLNTSKSGVDAAKVKSWKVSQDYKRYQNLIRDSAITTQQFENVKAEQEGSEAQMNIALGQQSSASVAISASEKQMDVAQSVIAQKQADLDYAMLQLSYSKITAPATGYVSRKNVQPGQLVNAGTPLFAVVSDTGIYVVANFKETQLMKMDKNETVEIKVDAFPDMQLQGRVYAFSPATGAKFSLLPPDNATGNFVKVVQRVPVKIIIDAGKEVKEKLRPGMSVKVAVKID